MSMKPETRLKKFIEKYWSDKSIKDGFSIWIDKKTDIWYLIGFDINKKMFIISKSKEDGTYLDKLKTLFSGYDFTLNANEWDNVEFFPGFYHGVNVVYLREQDGIESVQGVCGIYEFV